MKEEQNKTKRSPELNKLNTDQCVGALQDIGNLHKFLRAEVIQRAKRAANKLVQGHTASSGLAFVMNGQRLFLALDAPHSSQLAAEFLQAEAQLPEVLGKSNQDTDPLVEATFRLAYLAHGVLVAFVMERVVEILTAYSRVRAGSIKGNEKRNGHYRALQTCYPREVDRLMDKQGLSYTAACKKVGKAFDVDERTVREHTENKRPFNRGGHKSKPR